MATLQLAERTGPAGFSRRVALKRIHPHLSRDAMFVRMFIEEALLCARLCHPNVVHVEELGEDEHGYFLAMEYVDGCTLGDLLAYACATSQRLSAPIVVSIACAVLEGLDAAHTLRDERGEPLEVVHRDVSPSNVMIDRAGHVRLIDFGVARMRGRSLSTSSGAIKGKFAYMSPEQAAGEPLDLRSDLYSLAVVMWEALALRRMVEGSDDLHVLTRVRDEAPPRLAPHAPALSSALVAVVEGALARAPGHRPPSARALRAALLRACPEARHVEAAELASLVERAAGARPGACRTMVAFTASTQVPRAVAQPAAPRKAPRVALMAAALGALLALAGTFWSVRASDGALPATPDRAEAP